MVLSPAACDTIIELLPERVVDDVVQSVTVRCEKLKDAAEFNRRDSGDPVG